MIENKIEIFLRSLKEKNISEKTIQKKKEALSLFLDWAKSNNLLIFKKREINLYKKHLKERDFSKTAIENNLRVIDCFLKYSEDKEQESDVQKIINHYFQTKGYTLDDIKEDAKKKKIVYSRYTRPAKSLLELAGSVKKATSAIDKVAQWANSRNLDYAIETVFKKWPEIEKLKPKEKEKKPYYNNDPMVWSKPKRKWYVINSVGDWLEFADKEDKIEWREEN
jgi:hypothetical protein